jgi:1-acyl-sn-glycerol-3-phosphate acyltransferase
MRTEIEQDERKDIVEGFRKARVEKKNISSLFKDAGKILQEAVKEIEDASFRKDLSFEEAAGIIRKYINEVRPIFSALYMNSFGKIIRAYQMLIYSDVVDEFGYDPKFEDFIKPIFKFLYEKWWRVEVEGGENIPPKGRVLLVANHSGTLPFDGAMIKYYMREVHPAHRDVRPLAENFVYYLPFAGTIMNRVGGVRACQENAQILLMRDEAVIVFPEGVKGIVKPFYMRYKLQRFGRGGFVKLAIRTRSPILPVGVVGAEEIYPIIFKIDSLGKLFNLPTLPIVLNMLLLGPFGFIPFPSKWYIKFGKIIDVTEYPPEAAEDDILVNQISQEVRHRIEDIISELLSKRKSIWRG